jgi:hypothetical protein
MKSITIDVELRIVALKNVDFVCDVRGGPGWTGGDISGNDQS